MRSWVKYPKRNEEKGVTMGKVKKFIVELGGQLSKSFTSSFSSASSQMKQLQETSKKLAS